MQTNNDQPLLPQSMTQKPRKAGEVIPCHQKLRMPDKPKQWSQMKIGDAISIGDSDFVLWSVTGKDLVLDCLNLGVDTPMTAGSIVKIHGHEFRVCKSIGTQYFLRPVRGLACSYVVEST